MSIKKKIMQDIYNLQTYKLYIDNYPLYSEGKRRMLSLLCQNTINDMVVITPREIIEKHNFSRQMCYLYLRQLKKDGVLIGGGRKKFFQINQTKLTQMAEVYYTKNVQRALN